MKHLDLFSGIGGFSYAAQQVWGDEHEIVAFCEKDKFCQKVLNKHWPGVPIHTDVRRFKQQNEISKHRGYDYGRIDLLTGGHPCQPYSIAGKQRGSKDNRALWSEMLRVIKETNPNWVIGENVANFCRVDLDKMLSRMESLGYETTSFIIPACGVGAAHYRDRVWMVANSNGERLEGLYNKGDRVSMQLSEASWKLWEADPGMDRVAYGIPNRMDRIKALGNAIVPQVVIPIMQAIKEIENETLHA